MNNMYMFHSWSRTKFIFEENFIQIPVSIKISSNSAQLWVLHTIYSLWKEYPSNFRSRETLVSFNETNNKVTNNNNKELFKNLTTYWQARCSLSRVPRTFFFKNDLTPLPCRKSHRDQKWFHLYSFPFYKSELYSMPEITWYSRRFFIK